MKSTRLHLIAIATIAATASSVWASDMSGPTREQVRAELMQAQRNGTLIANGETGATFRNLNPGNYMAKPATQGLSRAEVQAAFEQARANGELIVSKEIGLTAHPWPKARRVQKYRQSSRVPLPTALSWPTEN